MTNMTLSAMALTLALGLAAPAWAQDAAPGGGAQTPPAAGDQTQPPADQTQQPPAGGGDQTQQPPAGGQQTQPPAGGTQTTTTNTDVNVNITSDQQTQIHQVITETHIQPITVNFDVSIGIAVPQTVVLQPLPAQIIALVPQFQGYLFFLLPDGRIVIVAPTTLKVVYIIG
jgi:hypothetical protein